MELHSALRLNAAILDFDGGNHGEAVQLLAALLHATPGLSCELLAVTTESLVPPSVTEGEMAGAILLVPVGKGQSSRPQQQFDESRVMDWELPGLATLLQE